MCPSAAGALSAPLRAAMRGWHREGVILTCPSEGVWTGLPLGTSCNNLVLQPEGKQQH